MDALHWLIKYESANSVQGMRFDGWWDRHRSARWNGMNSNEFTSEWDGTYLRDGFHNVIDRSRKSTIASLRWENKKFDFFLHGKIFCVFENYYFFMDPYLKNSRENLGIFDKKIKIFVDFLSKFLEFERKYSSAMQIGAACAKNWEFWPSRSQNSTL